MSREAKLKSMMEAMAVFGRLLLGFDRSQLYRPEAHYMRGPGPKWRAMHGEPKRAVVRAIRSAKAR